MTSPLKTADKHVYDIIHRETLRQEYGLEMIPSENFVSEAVLEAIGSTLTNKYAEGLPGKRYYGGCEVVDEVEQLAIERSMQLFGVDFVNVQPHSGAQANHAVFEAFLTPGDTFMGMRLDHGGHLTHGHPINLSGKNYKVVSYGVSEETGIIDMDQVRDLAKANSPKIIIAGASAYSRKIDFKTFREIADEVGAIFMADVAHYAGLIAGDAYPTPIGHAHVTTTTTHKTLRGPRAGLIMATADHGKAINRAVFPGIQGGPHMHIIAAKAVAFGEALAPSFKEYAKQTVSNAQTLATELQNLGLKIVSNGTDSHVMVLDVRPLNVNGKEAQETLDSVGITGNKNTIPFDPLPPAVCSGFRIGTPALTTRGMKNAEMKEIAGLIVNALQAKGDEKKLAEVKESVVSIAKKFPLYANRLMREEA